MSDGGMINQYFNSLAEALDVDSKSSAFGGHRPDSGSNREDLLISLLNKHLPDRLKAVSGGVVLNLEGELSRQIDVIVKNDLFPKFERHEKTCVISESVAGVISVKSKLDKAALVDSIENVASVPSFSEKTLSFNNSSIIRSDLRSQFSVNWPFRAIFAYDSIDPDTIYKYSLDIYKSFDRQRNLLPDMIIVNKKLCIRFLREGGVLQGGAQLPPNYLNPSLLESSTFGYPIAGMIAMLNNYVPWMHYMKFNFSPYIDKAFGLA